MTIPWGDKLLATYVFAERLIGVKLSLGEKMLIRHEAERLYPSCVKDAEFDYSREPDEVQDRATTVAAYYAIGAFVEKFDIYMPEMEEVAAEARADYASKGRAYGLFAPHNVTARMVLHKNLSFGGGFGWQNYRSAPWILKG
jgi:hypothetical protein